MFNLSEISKISEINLPVSPDRSIDFSFAAKAFEKILDQYFTMKLVSSSFD